MKNKKLFLLSCFFLSICSFFTAYKYQNLEVFSNLVLQNIESLAQGEGSDHGNIDSTLEPYYKQSSKVIWIIGANISTVIPCCESVSSRYSGCARGLDRC